MATRLPDSCGHAVCPSSISSVSLPPLSLALYAYLDYAFSVSSSTYQTSSLCSSFDLDSLDPAFEELFRHVFESHPLNSIMFVDVVNDARDVSDPLWLYRAQARTVHAS